MFCCNILKGQASENPQALNRRIGEANCPNEKIELHLSQESLFSGELLWFKVYCTSPLFPKEELSSLAFIELVNNDNASVLREKILLKHGEGSGEFLIPDSLSTGIYHLLAYTNWMKNFGEASFARDDLTIINPWIPYNKAQDRNDSTKIPLIAALPDNSLEPVRMARPGGSLNITSDRDTYSTRQQVTMNVESNNNSNGKITNLSVSVYRKEPQMIFYSVKSNLPAGGIVGIPDKITWLPDYKGIRLTGRLTDISENEMAGASLIASIIGKGTDIKQSLTDTGGNFNFLLKSKEGEQEVVFETPSEGAKISLEEPFWNGFRSPPADQSLILDNEAISYLRGKFNHYQLQLRFKKQNYLKSPAEKIDEDSIVFYSKPYQLIELSNYIALDSLREYFYELVPSVRFGMRKGEINIAVRDSVNQSFYEDKPGVFVDGILYNDYSQIARIPVKEIARIAILPKVYYYKDFTFGGIIDIHTKKSDFNSVKPLPVMTRIIYPLAEPFELKFNSPDHSLSGSNDRTPDFRYLLYWNPEIQSDNSDKATIKFYTGDVKGTFVIKIMGLSLDGSIIHAEREIVVE